MILKEKKKTIKEETQEELLSRVTGEVASKYYIQGYEYSDLFQEAYILAMEVLAKYNPDKGRLENFIRVALNNAMQNFVRSRTTEKKPCGCDNGTYCEKCQYRESKLRVLSPSQYPEEVEFSKDTHIRDSFIELLPLINQKLPLSMRMDWRRILDDAHVVKSRKEEIFEEIREIVCDFERRSVNTIVDPFESGWENSYFYIENSEHLVKLYMDEEAANIWLHTLSPEARQIYMKIRECGLISYEEICILAQSIDENNGWDI